MFTQKQLNDFDDIIVVVIVIHDHQVTRAKEKNSIK